MFIFEAMKSEIAIIPIPEQTIEIWKEFARVQFSATQKLISIDKDIVGLSELEMRQYHQAHYNPQGYFVHIFGKGGENYAYAAVYHNGAGTLPTYSTLKPGDMLGFINGKFFKTDFSLTVNALYVDGNFQKKGIGDKLLAAAELLGKEKGARKISLKSTKTARRFYIDKNGYTDLGNDKMGKNLTPGNLNPKPAERDAFSAIKFADFTK